jgi:2-oxo-4-hydroxy-4-carboxy-5-ureidoimidazoline decarboxylase
LKTTISHLNALPTAAFVEQLSAIFEHSPWVAEKAAASRPYANTKALHHAMIQIVDAAGEEAHLKLLNAHPDLVGKTLLTAESASEQAAAGLTHLSEQEKEKFHTYNQAYRKKFGFPFILCARLNKKQAILATFPQRLAQTRAVEITTALEEIAKIARLRLEDIIG